MSAKSAKLTSPIKWENLKTIAVVGETGAGKTATCFKILDQFRKKKFIFNHPQPHILKAAGVSNIEKLSLHELSDCVVYIDEPQLTFVDAKETRNLIRLYSLARQRDITILFSTSDTRWVSIAMEAYVDCWVIKNIDYSTVKRGSQIKKIIEMFVYNINPESFRLDIDEAIMYCRRFLPDGPQKIKVLLPKYYDDYFSKPYKYASISEDDFFPGVLDE